MEFMKKSYYYFFYKIYKAIQYTSYPFGNFLLNFKACVVIITLEIWSLLTILNYYGIINNIKPNSSLKNPLIFVPFVIIMILNYITFYYFDTWEKYNQKFDQLPKKTNTIGSFVVWTIILFIIVIFFASTFHLHKTIYGKY